MPHAAKPGNTGAREEGNHIQQSRSLLSLLLDGSPGDKILQLLLQLLTTLLESSHGFLTSCSHWIQSFLKSPISSSMTAVSVIPEALLCSCNIF